MGGPAPNPPPSLPVGTQVVTRADAPGRAAGAVGVIVRPTGVARTYRVRFPDGTEAELPHSDFTLLRQFQQDGVGDDAAVPDVDLRRFVIYRCVIGSRAYGLDVEGSDTDRRGIYLPPADRHWSLRGVPEQVEDEPAQECYWELEKFLRLALKANPNVLECLYTPIVEAATPLAEELRALRPIFLSTLVYQTYNGYVLSQFHKLAQDVRTRGAPRWKHAMHLVRLLLCGATVLREGDLPVRVQEHRDRLLAIRRGEVPWAEVDAWRLELHGATDAARAASRLPTHPDFDRANAFLIRARRSMV